MINRFWIVCNPARTGIQSTYYQHNSFDGALLEAERLARENPESVFHVMASVEAVVKSDVRHIQFSDNTQEPSHDDIPF